MNLKKFRFEKEIEGIFEDYIKDLECLFGGGYKDIEREFISIAEDYPNLFIPFLFYNEGLYAFQEGNVNAAEEHFLKAIKAFTIFEIKGNLVKILPFFVKEIMPVDKKYKEIFNADSLVLMAGYLRSFVTVLNKKKWIEAFFRPNVDKGLKKIKKRCKNREELRPEDPFVAIGVKIKTIYALHDCLNFKAVDFNALDESRIVLRNIGYKKGKESIDAIENFVIDFEGLVESKHYKSVSQISEDDGRRLMKRLRVASDLSSDLSCFMAEKQSREIFKKDIAESVGVKISKQIQKLGDSLTKRVRADKRFKTEAEKAEYEILLPGKKKRFISSEKAGTIRDKKGTGKGIFIDDERKEVFVHKKYAEEFKDLMYAMLMHFVINDGVGGDSRALYIQVWGDAVAAERNRDDAVQQAVRRLRKILNKYGLGKVPELSKSKYSASKTYVMKPKPIYYILRKIEKEN